MTSYDKRLYAVGALLFVPVLVSGVGALAQPGSKPQPGQDIGKLVARDRQREAERAAIAKLQQRYITATSSRDPVALTDLWTDDAIRFIPGQPVEVGKQSIRSSNDRWAAREGVKVLSYVPDTKDVTMLDGWAVEWGHFTASHVDSPGGEAKQLRGMVLTVLKRLPDGSWNWFRRMGDTLIAPGGQMREDLPAPKGTIRGAAADVAAIEKVRQQSFAATVSRDPVALTDGWTDDGVLLAPGGPEVGKAAIGAYYERQTVNKGFKVLSYVPEVVDLAFLSDGWAVEWRSFTGSYVDAPEGEAKHARGTVLLVWKKLADGNWKAFRALGM